MNITVDSSDLGVIVEGASIGLICTSSFNADLYNDLQIIVEWSRNGFLVFNDSNFTINPFSMVSNAYISTLQIHEVLQSYNGDVYTCNVRFESSINPMFIDASNSGNNLVLNIGSELCEYYLNH